MAEDTVLSVDRFMADVKILVEKDLCSSFEDFKKDLLQIATAKGLSSAKHKQIQQCAHKLLKLIKRHSKTNIHKFELYALKNIFSSAASLTEDPPSSSRPEKQQRYPEILSSREQELESLRARYADLAGQNSFLRDEAALSELLLHGMDKTLFDLRVGSQALDAYEGVMPLSNSMAGVAQGHRDLQQLLLRARMLTGDILSCGSDENMQNQQPQQQLNGAEEGVAVTGYTGAGSRGGSSSSSGVTGLLSYVPNEEEEEEDDIDTIDADDIRQLNDLLK